MNRLPRLITLGLTLVVAAGITMSAASAGAPKSPTDTGTAGTVVPMAPPVASQPPSEMSYVPITPCRIVDTRNAVGRLGNGTSRSYYVGGTSGFAPRAARRAAAGYRSGPPPSLRPSRPSAPPPGGTCAPTPAR